MCNISMQKSNSTSMQVHLSLYQPSKGGLPTSKICVFLAVSRVKASMIIFNYHSTGLNVPL